MAATPVELSAVASGTPRLLSELATWLAAATDAAVLGDPALMTNQSPVIAAPDIFARARAIQNGFEAAGVHGADAAEKWAVIARMSGLPKVTLSSLYYAGAGYYTGAAASIRQYTTAPTDVPSTDIPTSTSTVSTQ